MALVSSSPICPRVWKKVKSFGKGNFGETIAVVDEHSKEYALKKFTYPDPNLLNSLFERQTEFLNKFSHSCLVKQHDVWIEQDNLFLLMELCDDNLHNILSIKPYAFARPPDHPISRAEYYLSWHLLRDLSRALNHLHSQQPPIVHRNLKPDNCLITYFNSEDDPHRRSNQQLQYLKLSDFGITDLFDGHRADPREDIYSLVVIALQLFGFDIGTESNQPLTTDDWIAWFDYAKPDQRYHGTWLMDKMKIIFQYLKTCILSSHYTQLPSSSEFLDVIQTWSISPHHVQQDPCYVRLNDHLAQITDKFFFDYIHYKSSRYWEFWIWSPRPAYSLFNM